MHQWKRFALCVYFAQASAFTTQRNPLKVPSGPLEFPSVGVSSVKNDIATRRLSFAPPLISQTKDAFNFRRRKGRKICSSATVDQDEAEGQSTSDTPPNGAKKDDDNSKMPRSLPWSEFHDWALRDNIPKYTRILPGETPKTYALWRTMLQEVPELSGYPIDFLQTKFASKPLKKADQKTTGSNATRATAPETVPEKLPFLDNFYFEPSGGLSGQVRANVGIRYDLEFTKFSF